ncbi:mechanosensitive ion channel family protein [Sphingomonas sp. 1P06PA]|uniref:mechanosensitive ion channel family protein n=1 Tax=Sphingomonas sp. 1P06PA TaxID=554121 RepID=UPI0039A4053E
MSNTTSPAAPPFSVDQIANDATLATRDGIAWLTSHWLQIAIAIAIAFVIVAILGFAKSLGMKLAREEMTAANWRVVVARVIGQTRVWFMIALAAKLVDGYAQPPAAVAQTVTFLFTVAAAIQGALWAREAILGAVEHRAGGDVEHGTLGSALGIIRLLVTVVLFAIATLMILDNLGVNVTGLVAGLGIGGIAIGLAAKGIFDDLFSALSIIFDKPFRKGDSIRWDQTSGSVEAIGLKTTRVRALTGEEVVISNTNLLNKELHNMARLARRRIVMVLGVTYETPVETLQGIPARVRAIVESHDKCTVVRCGMTSFGASSLDFELQFDVHSENYDEVFDARSSVALSILKDFNEAGIAFAYPTTTNYTAAPDGSLVLPYPDVQKITAVDDDGNHAEAPSSIR